MGGTSSRRLADLLGGIAGDRRPRYAALASRIRVLTADGRLPVGARLPAERDLAAAVGLSRTTVRAAYARLREDGWATARRGAGTWTALPAGPNRGVWFPPRRTRGSSTSPCRAVGAARGLGGARRRPGRPAAGPRFGTGHAFDDRLRLPFTHPPEVLQRAVDRLADADADAEATGVPTPTDRGRTAPIV
jgi:hypothetical protein